MSKNFVLDFSFGIIVCLKIWVKVKISITKHSTEKPRIFSESAQNVTSKQIIKKFGYVSLYLSLNIDNLYLKIPTDDDDDQFFQIFYFFFKFLN